MKKFLLTLAAVVCAGVASAFEPGDYIYTANAKFKVTGDNLVKNGDFSSLIGDEWGGYDSESWSQETDEDAGTVLQSQSSAEGALIYQNIKIEQGLTYVVSLKVKASATASSIISAGVNQIDAFVTTDPCEEARPTGTANVDYMQVAKASQIGNEWTDIIFSFNDTISAHAEGAYLNIVLGRLTDGTMVTGVEVREANEVYDTRVAEREVAKVKKMLALGKELGIQIGKSEIEDALEQVEDDIETNATMSSFKDDMAWMMEELEAFLNNGSARVTHSWDIETAEYGFNKISKYGDWNLSGGRWGATVNHGMDDLVLPGEGTAACAGIQTSYNLSVGINYWAANAEPGKYIFEVEAKAAPAVNKATPYGVNYNIPVTDPYIVLGNTTQVLEGDTIPNSYFKHYVFTFDVAEGDTLYAEFHFPNEETHEALKGKGGVFAVRNPMLRKVGESEDQREKRIAYENAVAKFKGQQDALKSAVKAAEGYIASAEYPWAKPQCADSLEKVTPLLEWTYKFIDQNGNVLLAQDDEAVDFPDAEVRETGFVAADAEVESYTPTEFFNTAGSTTNADPFHPVMDAVRVMQGGNNKLVNTNMPYTDIKVTIARANNDLQNPAYAEAPAAERNALTDAKQIADELVASTTDDDSNSDEYVSANAALLSAVKLFEQACATVKAPAELDLLNQNFEKYSGSKASLKVTDWDCIPENSNGGFEDMADAAYDGGRKISCWRGATAGPLNKITQKITLTNKGVYRFTCQAMAWNESYDVQMREIIYEKKDTTWIDEEGEQQYDVLDVPVDTVYHTGIFLVFGPEAEGDSLQVHTAGAIERFEMFYEKTSEGEEVIELGLDGMTNGNDPYANPAWTKGGDRAFCNTYAFGSPRLFYYGKDASIEDVKKAIAEDIDVNESEETVVDENAPVYNLSGIQVAKSLKGAVLPEGIYVVGESKVYVK